MTAQTVSWSVVAPVVALAAAALLALLADLLGLRGRIAARLPALVALLGLGLAAAAVVGLWGDTAGTFCVPPDAAGGLPSCGFVVDPLTLVFQAVVVGSTALVVLMADAELAASRIPSGEFHFLLLSSAAGAATLAAARDLATLVVALELVSLPAVALVGLRRGEGRSSEAALTFFLVSVVSVAVMLFGISLVYGVTGSLHLDRVAAALAGPVDRPAVAAAAVALTLIGLLFKVSAVPLHFWAPDTYAGAPVSVAAYLSVVSKSAGVVGLLVVLTRGFPSYAHVWGPALAVVAALTMTLGNAAALRQTSAVRLLAWSSIAQAGYLLSPLAVAASTARVAEDPAVLGRALSATVGYVCIYAVVNLGAFAVVSVVTHGGVGGVRPVATLGGYGGLVRRDPGSGLALAFFLLCLAGLPPGLAGLFAKVVVVSALVDGAAAVLAILVVLNTAAGLAYYLPWVARLFARSHTPGADADLDLPWPSAVAIGTAFVLAVLLSVQPQLVLQLLPVQAGTLG
jgi:NADH-quinone oxidoreductase subunit N